MNEKRKKKKKKKKKNAKKREKSTRHDRQSEESGACRDNATQKRIANTYLDPIALLGNRSLGVAKALLPLTHRRVARRTIRVIGAAHKNQSIHTSQCIFITNTGDDSLVVRVALDGERVLLNRFHVFLRLEELIALVFVLFSLLRHFVFC
jgi:hypothetical protein